MNDQNHSEEPFGTYAPAGNTCGLRLLTRLGLTHGKLTQILLARWLKSHGPLVDAEVRGIKYRFNLSNNNTDTKILISSKVHDSPELAALQTASRGKVFVDIGANTGYYTLALLAGACKRVISIEPNPPTLARLRFNLAVNGHNERVTVIPEGVGPEGELLLYQTSGLGSASFVPPDSNTPTLKVRTRSLLTMLQAEGLDTVGGMKIDVEGFEDQVLTPFFRDAPDHLLPQCLVMEACHEEKWRNDLKLILKNKGYTLVRQTRSNLVFKRQP